MKRRYPPPPRKVSRSGKTRVRAARDPICAIVSNSESPAGSCSDLMRRDWGMSTSRSSIDPTPIAASIASRSSGAWTRYGKLVVRRLRDLFVFGFVEEIGGGLARQLELDDPTLAVWICVDKLGVSGELVVDRCHSAGDRCVQITRRLYRLHHSKALAGVKLASGAGYLEAPDVPQ